MLIQVVHCHPLCDSYNHALFRTIVDALEKGGHDVIATDLYRQQFDPVMNAAERRSYYQARYDDAAVSADIALLRRVQGIIFCFPHWWFSMPAMLKGYFDRVWAPGVAFEHDLAAGRLRPLLTHIRLFGVVTTYGSPWWMTRLVAGDPGRKVLMRALKPMCGRHVRSFFLAQYGLDRATPAERAAFLLRVRDRAARICKAAHSIHRETRCRTCRRFHWQRQRHNKDLPVRRERAKARRDLNRSALFWVVGSAPQRSRSTAKSPGRSIRRRKRRKKGARPMKCAFSS